MRRRAARHETDELNAERIRTLREQRAWSQEHLATVAGLSTRTLQRSLQEYGTDFRSLGNAIRAKRAAELLRGTNASVTDISAELGYSAPANFARAFRKATGLAPEDFRRGLRGGAV